MTRFTFQSSVTKGAPAPCTQEIFEALLDSPQVADICAEIASIDMRSEQYEDRKGALKKQLPIIIPHASAFRNPDENDNHNGPRKSSLAIPSGLVMIDVDHLVNPRDVFIMQVEPVLLEQDIYFAAITPSGHGLRLLAERRKGESVPDAQQRLAAVCDFDVIDGVTTDLARASFMMPRSYVLHYRPEGLFSFPDPDTEAYWKNDNHNDNLNPNGETTGVGSKEQKTTQKGLSPLCSFEGKELKYRGLPYSEIVDQLMTAIGANGGAVQGERNTVYFSLANYMRYICDFDASLLLQVLPDFGLSAEERRNAIHSALGRPRKVSIPLVLEGAIAQAQAMRSPGGGDAGGPTQEMLPLPPLPPLYKIICKRLPDTYRPAMLIAALPILGALATRIRFRYLDQQEHSLSFFSCITAPAASGKSFIRQPLQLLLTPIDEQDRVEREKEQHYKEQLRASKNSKNQPEDPRACPRNNGVNISIAKLLQLLTYSEGKHLIGIGEEMDTLVKSERAGVWSQKSDIYRLAFDNAEYGQAYMSDQSFSAHVPVFYNLVMTGTPNSMKRFFKDLENGLATRVCFAQLPDTSFSEIPVFNPYSDDEKREIIRWARVMNMESGDISCPAVGAAISEWLEEKRQQAIECDSRAMDTFRRRSAVIGYRAGMLCYLLYGHPDQSSRKAAVNHKKDIAAFSTWVAEYVFRGQMQLWGQQMEQELGGSADQTYGAPMSSLLEQLPQQFETSQLISLRSHNGQSVKTKAVAMVLSRWKQAGKIRKLGDNLYEKLV